MKPNVKELNAIKLSETYYNKKYKGFINKYLFLKFRFQQCEVSAEKTLEALWLLYGLKNNNKFQFSDQEKLECINKWFKILYSLEFDLVADYDNKLREFQQQARKYHLENPNEHINWNFPSPENYILDMKAEFGYYDNRN